MKNFDCPKCGKKFNQNSHLKTHLNRRRSCTDVNNFICNHCNKTFSTKSSLNRHTKNSCQIIDRLNSDNQQKDMEIELLKNKLEISELKRELAEMKSGMNNTLVQGDLVQGDKNEINIKVEVRNFGNENLEDIIGNMQLMKAVFDKRNNGARRLMNEIYFNPKHPENQCIKIADASREKFLIKENDRWVYYIGNEEVARKTYSGVNDIAHKSLEYMDKNGIPIDSKYVQTYNSNKFVYFGSEDVALLGESLVESCMRHKEVKEIK